MPHPQILRAGHERLTDRRRRRLAAAFADDRHVEVEVAYACAQAVREVYRQDAGCEGRRRAEHILATLPGCAIVEVARLGKTLRQWSEPFLAPHPEV